MKLAPANSFPPLITVKTVSLILPQSYLRKLPENETLSVRHIPTLHDEIKL